ncbi:MAG: Fic family protein [Holosporales bacterium]|jgi:Fic family protein|nr:Fic family protein [Holosporales bacterium]
MFKKPPFRMTSIIIDCIQKICIILGRIDYCNFRVHSDVHLRKITNIRSVKSSLAIEGHSLMIEQVSDILNGQVVIAPQHDIIAVKNAMSVYEMFDLIDAFSIDDLVKVHGIMMKDLLPDAGNFRQSGVGLFKGKQVVHVAPPHKNVSRLMADLFTYLKGSDDSLLIKSCVFHYEFEFIHPFLDGNGRMGRLWQQLILARQHPVFKLVCIEELLEKYQSEYYDALHESDLAGSSEKFIEFMLNIILQSLAILETQIQPAGGGKCEDRLAYAKGFLDNFRRKDYLNLFKKISPATASRDLINGVKRSILETTNNKNQTIYKFKR